MELLEQRLDKELEHKKKLDEENSKNKEDNEQPKTKRLKSDKKHKKDKPIVEVENGDNQKMEIIGNNDENTEEQDDQVENRIENQVEESPKKSHLDCLKDELNELNAKKKPKKKKKPQPEVKLSDEDNLDLKLDKTVSIAIPASIILNAQTSELKAYLIGQIARCAVIFNINEIVVFDEYCTDGDFNDDECEDDKVVCVRQMANLLRYLECPQYLRKSLFPLHKDFRSAGVINPLDTKHHLRFEDESEFREGVVNKTKNGKSFVYVGLQKEALVNKEIEPGTRVTVKLDIFEERNYLNGKVVSPYLPTKKLGYYWGYEVRVAKSLSKVFENCPFGEGSKYDLVIGTSDKGEKLETVEDELIDRDYKHAIIILGGLKGLEFSMTNDKDIENKNANDYFQYYLNTCPFQGSNVIRTEEALLISLSKLSDVLF